MQLQEQPVGFSTVFGTQRAHFGPQRQVVAHVRDMYAVSGHRSWEADVDVIEADRAWRTRCVLRPVRNHVVVPSLDPDPELVCWTLPGGNAPFELTIVLEGPLMTGHIVFGSRRLSVEPLEGSSGPAAAFSLEGKMVAVVDPSRGCMGKVFFDDALERDAQTAVSFTVSVLMWATPYENRLNLVHKC